eukprot:6188312-Pleurochrysis_carterae.AAC.1
MQRRSRLLSTIARCSADAWIHTRPLPRRIHDTEASCRVRHRPMAVRVGLELCDSSRLLYYALVGVLRRVIQHPVGVLVHRGDGKSQSSR